MRVLRGVRDRGGRWFHGESSKTRKNLAAELWPLDMQAHESGLNSRSSDGSIQALLPRAWQIA